MGNNPSLLNYTLPPKDLLSIDTLHFNLIIENLDKLSIYDEYKKKVAKNLENQSLISSKSIYCIRDGYLVLMEFFSNGTDEIKWIFGKV